MLGCIQELLGFRRRIPRFKPKQLKLLWKLWPWMHPRATSVESSVTHCLAVPTVLFTGILKSCQIHSFRFIQIIICRHSKMLPNSLLRNEVDVFLFLFLFLFIVRYKLQKPCHLTFHLVVFIVYSLYSVHELADLNILTGELVALLCVCVCYDWVCVCVSAYKSQ